MRWQRCLDLLLKKDMELRAICTMVRIISKHGIEKFGFWEGMPPELVIRRMWEYINRGREIYTHYCATFATTRATWKAYKIGEDRHFEKFGVPVDVTEIVIRHWVN